MASNATYNHVEIAKRRMAKKNAPKWTEPPKPITRTGKRNITNQTAKSSEPSSKPVSQQKQDRDLIREKKLTNIIKNEKVQMLNKTEAAQKRYNSSTKIRLASKQQALHEIVKQILEIRDNLKKRSLTDKEAMREAELVTWRNKILVEIQEMSA